MLGDLLCSARRLFTPLSFALGGGSASHHRIFIGYPVKLVEDRRRRSHHSACRRIEANGGGAASSIWNAMLPAQRNHFQKNAFHHEQKGEGSWNVAWDVRPARWLHRPDSAWLLFGVRACQAPPPEFLDFTFDQSVSGVNVDKIGEICSETLSDSNLKNSANYRVTGVLADGRCLFRAIAHMACLRNGEEAPDQKQQTELADKLRAQVVDELLMRRKETEWFIEGDFDAYVERIKQPYVWGGEPELLMASHVLKTMISVYMLDRSSGNLINIVNYGEEYQKDGESPIKVLFHGYGHYDILEMESEQSCKKAET